MIVRFERKLKPITGRLDIAPFAGVCLLLILFLTLHSRLAPPPGIQIRLPESASASPMGAANLTLVVAVDREEVLYYDHQVIKEPDLKLRLTARVREAKEPVAVLVQADEAVRQAAVVRVAAIARAAGAQEVVIATRPPLFPPPAPAKK
jgi:biopolymer transport protein ExbD